MKCKSEGRILNKSLHINAQEPCQLPSFAHSKHEHLGLCIPVEDWKILPGETDHTHREKSFSFSYGLHNEKAGRPHPTAESLNLSTIDILDQITLCRGWGRSRKRLSFWFAVDHLLVVSSHGGEPERGSERSQVSSYKGTNSIVRAPPSGPN